MKYFFLVLLSETKLKQEQIQTHTHGIFCSHVIYYFSFNLLATFPTIGVNQDY